MARRVGDSVRVIRDLIYFDFDRTASIYSQVAEGLVKEIRSGVEASSDQRSIRKYDLKVFKPEFGGIATEKTSQIESKILHHDLLAKTEAALFDAGLAVDVNESAAGASDYETVRANLSDRCYVRVEGWAAVEDYERLTALAGRFRSLARFVGMCQLNSPEKRPLSGTCLRGDRG